MANRAYLYSCSGIPGEDEKVSITGVSEWNYDIPLLFKLLVSSQPRVCDSMIFDPEDAEEELDDGELDEKEEKIALLGDFEGGLANLEQFLSRIEREDVSNAIEEARQFLASDTVKNRYFLLECAEVFWMDDENAEIQNQRLLEEVKNIVVTSKAVATELHERSAGGVMSRLISLFKPAPYRQSYNDVLALGFGNWSNTLFYTRDE
ncbi:DUF7822 domain-containing protein [Vreelandella sp. EE7]